MKLYLIETTNLNWGNTFPLSERFTTKAKAKAYIKKLEDNEYYTELPWKFEHKIISEEID